MDPITDAQSQALIKLAGCVDPSTYLAGGVAVAIRFHHRQSRDIDLFTPSEDPSAHAEVFAKTALGIVITGRSEGTLHLEVGGVPTSWLRYRYPSLSPPERIDGIPIQVASLEDLTGMKLSAITGRGAARDFWDLHEILVSTNLALPDALQTFRRKYATEDIGHVIKSLAYFADAESEPLPRGLDAAHWERIKAEFRSWVGAL